MGTPQAGSSMNCCCRAVTITTIHRAALSRRFNICANGRRGAARFQYLTLGRLQITTPCGYAYCRLTVIVRSLVARHHWRPAGR